MISSAVPQHVLYTLAFAHIANDQILMHARVLKVSTKAVDFMACSFKSFQTSLFANFRSSKDVTPGCSHDCRMDMSTLGEHIALVL